MAGAPASSPDNGRPTHDELDREQLSQLHAATLKIAESCFELKKLCATVLVPLATLLSIFTDRQLNSAVFMAPIGVIVAFWMADSVGYLYQSRLRARMAKIWQRRADRCYDPYHHVPEDAAVSVLRAAFNPSMIYYLALLVLMAAALVFFVIGVAG